MIQENTICEEKKELYQFGVQQGFTILFNMVSFLLIGYVFGMVWQSVVFLAGYMPLRVFAGGFHARTSGKCYLYSCLLLGIILTVLRYSQGVTAIYAGLSIVAGAVIWIFSPAEDKNKPLDKEEERVYRHRARMILLLEVIACVISCFLSEQLFYCICLGIITNSTMVFVTGLKSNSKIQK